MTSITKLIPPKSGKITEIIHISDIHIRNGDEISCRYDEYNYVFDKLFSNINSLESIKSNSAIIVITGDTFHNKSKVETPGIMLFNKLMTNLGKLAPVYIILGNHDFRQDQIDSSIDFLEAFENVSFQNVCYLKNSGLYESANIGFGLVSVKDTLRLGAGSGMCDVLPEFPNPKLFSNNISTKIALFHGTMINSKFSENRTTSEGYPWNWMDIGYDLGLLGDVHKQQIFVRKSGFKAGYSGSLIQQNFGESLFNHGYLLWKINEKENSPIPVEIQNNCGYLKLCIKNNEWFCENKTLKSLISNNSFPNNLKIRIFGESNMLLRESLRKLLYGKDFVLDDTIINDISENSQSSDFASDLLLDEYMKSNNISDYEIPSLEELKIPIDDKWNNELKKISHKKNIDIDKEYTTYLNSIERTNNLEKICIKYIEWKGLLCYSDKNWFDFDILKNKTNLISAKNGGGKSSFLEIICVSIFGKPIPSRNVKGNAYALISKNLEKNSIPYTHIHIVIKNKIYKISRFFDKLGRPKARKGGVYILENDKWNVICSDPPKTNEWVSKNLGDIRGFLMTTMVSQSNDDDFLSMKQSEQKHHLEQIFGMKIANSKASLFKQSYLAIKQFKSHYDVFCASQETLITNASQDALDTANLIYKIKSNELDNLSKNLITDWNNCKIDDLKRDIEYINSILETYSICFKEDSNKLNELNIQLEEANTIKENLYPPCKKPVKTIKELEYLTSICPMTEPIQLDYVSIPIINLEEANKIEKNVICQQKNKPDSTEYYSCKETYSNTINKINNISEELDENKTKLINYLNIEENLFSSRITEKVSIPKENKDNILSYLSIIESKRDIIDSLKIELDKYLAQITLHNLHKNLYKINQDKLSNICISITDIEKSLENIPFNPKCNACIQQPLRQQLKKFIIEKNNLQHILLNYVVPPCPTMEYDKLNLEICEYDKHIKLEQSYKEIIEAWNKYDEYRKNIELNEKELIKTRNVIRDLRNQIELQQNHIKDLENISNNSKNIIEKYESISSKENLLDERAAFAASIKAQWNLYELYKENELAIANFHKGKNAFNDLEEARKYSEYTNICSSNSKTISRINSKIDQINKNISKTQQHIDYWNIVKQNKATFDKQQIIENTINICKLNLQELYSEKTVIETMIKQNNAISAINNENKRKSNDFKNKLDHLQLLAHIYEQYRCWLYKEHILPKLINTTNRFISKVEPNLKLDYLIKQDSSFVFQAINNLQEIQLEKTSGFEYFILAICLRLAFISLTMGDTKFGGQLLIDEGFTYCDTNHLSKIPGFLESLLNNFDSIILVSHLEKIKDSVDNTIFINNKKLINGSCV